jgi:polyisoprenyl-phosphate glycosyltransferase
MNERPLKSHLNHYPATEVEVLPQQHAGVFAERGPQSSARSDGPEVYGHRQPISTSAAGIDVSVVVPAYNEMGGLALLWERVTSVLEASRYTYEILIVDDGSTDQSLSVLRHLSREDARLRYISFSRNFGHQAALMAGIEMSRGNAIITMDADLQHPPGLLLEMLETWKRGYYVVNTRKERDAGSYFGRSMLDKVFYWSLRNTSGLVVEGSDFRLLDRRVVEVLRQLPEREKILRGLVAWVGFPQTTIPYVVGRRLSGTSKYTVRKRVSLAFSALLSFSRLPLRALSFMGSVVVVISLILLAAVAFEFVHATIVAGTPSLPPPWVILVGIGAFFGGAQLAALGLLGEYIGRIHTEMRGRPTYLIKETSDQLSPLVPTNPPPAHMSE